jgi:uncharacterized protein YycO
VIHTYEINGLPVQTGDLICTINGNRTFGIGQFWYFVGKLIPGAVDHIAVYIGPGGRCVEAGAKFRVVTFNVKNKRWKANKMTRQRGPLIDTFKRISKQRKLKIRESVAKYCLRQAKARKPYNLNFLNSKTEKAFYCSQLAYKAYLRDGIDLNTEKGVPKIPGTKSIIFPQEIWSGCAHKRP